MSLHGSILLQSNPLAGAGFVKDGAMQRVKGAALVQLAVHQNRTRLINLRQEGNAKAILPHAGPHPEVVFLNTSGGLTGGDQLSYRLDLGRDCRAVAMTQTAERAYRAKDGQAQVDIDLSLGRGAWLDWLPQETILFEGSALRRKTRIDLGQGAGCLALEAVVLGRHAMGETVKTLNFQDKRAIYRQGKPVFFEPLMLNGGNLDSPVTLAGSRAFASIVMIGEGVADALEPLRSTLTEEGVEAAASAFDGKLTCRMRAYDGWPLRRQITRALAVLRREPLPRVWQTLERMA